MKTRKCCVIYRTKTTILTFGNKMSTLHRSSNPDDNHESSCSIFARFPEVINDKIETDKFLEASRGVLKLIDKFGKLLAPVKYDMQGNIEKLSARYSSDEEMNSTLQDMVLLEIAIGNSVIATNSLLWLTRCLHMIQSFFEKIVDDCKSEKGTEDLVAILKKSYEESLEPYHGWMAKQLFGLLSRMVPSRSYILQTLAKEIQPNEDTILDVMSDFTRRLKNNVTTLYSFYEEYELDNRRD